MLRPRFRPDWRTPAPYTTCQTQDAGTRLARLLLNADEICFLAGDAINPQQLADVVRGRPMRQVYLDELVALLRQREKQIKVEHW
jgi:hypothetical protein